VTAVKGRQMTRAQLRLQRRMDKEARIFSGTWASHLNAKFKAYGLKAKEAFLHIAHRHGVMKDGPNWEDITQATNDAMGELSLDYPPMYLKVARMTYSAIDEILGLGVNLDAPAEYRIIAAGGKRMGLVDLPQQTRDAIYKAIEEGRREGDGAAAIADRIQAAVESGPWATSEMRSAMIARTETKYAQNISSIECYEGSDTVTALMVFDGRLDTSDEECMARDGDEVSFEEGRAMADSEHPNGTLSLAPVVDNAYDNGGT